MQNSRPDGLNGRDNYRKAAETADSSPDGINGRDNRNSWNFNAFEFSDTTRPIDLQGHN
jgi:hypothetical protein